MPVSSTQGYWYSAPEVVSDPGPHPVSTDFPEVVPIDNANLQEIKTGPWARMEKSHYPPAENHRSGSSDFPEPVPLSAMPKGARKHICGLAVSTFWTIFSVAAIVIVGGAVGGGIAASRVNDRAQSGHSPSSSTTSSLSPTSTTLVPDSAASSQSTTHTATPTTSKASTSVTTTSIVGPSQTLYRDCPSSEGTLYDVTFGDSTYMFRKFCNTVLVTLGYDNVVTGTTTDLDSCINKCATYNYQNPDGTPSNGTAWYVGFLLSHPHIVCYLCISSSAFC